MARRRRKHRKGSHKRTHHTKSGRLTARGAYMKRANRHHKAAAHTSGNKKRGHQLVAEGFSVLAHAGGSRSVRRHRRKSR